MEIQILSLVPDAVLPVQAPAATRPKVPHGYGVQEQCVPFTAAAALGCLVRSPISFGLCRPADVPAGSRAFRSPIEPPGAEGRFADDRVFYVRDDPACRYVGNAFTFDRVDLPDGTPFTPVQPGLSFFDRADQLDLFKLHLPYIIRTPAGTDCLFQPLINRPAPVDVLSGLVETDWYASPVNLVLRKPPGAGTLGVEKGEAIAQIATIERTHRRLSIALLPSHARATRELRKGLGAWYQQHGANRSAYKELVRSSHGRI